jgi:hypothetical protein
MFSVKSTAIGNNAQYVLFNLANLKPGAIKAFETAKLNLAAVPVPLTVILISFPASLIVWLTASKDSITFAICATFSTLANENTLVSF